MSALDGVRQLLVVRLDNLGDVVLCTPLLRALRRSLPDARITLLASPAGAAAAPLLPDVDEVRTLRALWQDASGRLPFDPSREQAVIERLADDRYDAAVISTSFSQSPHPAAYACYLAGVPLRAGISADFAGGVLTHPVPPPPDGTHQADRGLALAEGLGVPAAGRRLSLHVPDSAREAAAHVLGPLAGRPYAVLAPGASCPSRRYDPARFATVARGLSAAGLPVVGVGSAAEADVVARAVTGAGPSLAGATDVPALAAVVAGAAVVLTGNSGPMHLADALLRPVVVLFAGTERESEYRPRSAPARLLRRGTSCSPCRAFSCPYAMECLDVDPGEVVAAALELARAEDTACAS